MWTAKNLRLNQCQVVTRVRCATTRYFAVGFVSMRKVAPQKIIPDAASTLLTLFGRPPAQRLKCAGATRNNAKTVAAK